MTCKLANDLCQGFPGAQWSAPWGEGHDVWKVGGKVFACIGTVQNGVSVKTQSIEDAALLIDMDRATRAPYFHRSWVLVPFDAPPQELQDRLTTSYRLIRAGLPKKLQAALDPI
ncbi:MmcQ/YjbR family DNA-binding protein [Puniceibacterium sp. IMCC21224]|uniref:MmcQ/YjbR family DNA-binding protein n=1 Tax=Puniceibacterium sp. IMCC21224 TaxID=1618204 RepID=UPI00064DCB63|nr:MmcQ/YjbR family DNA-binding protein [Puniceibacterium sp. IMCC21224]